MILPLFLEQLLVMLVGMADTFVVSYAGESAMSGMSLVNQFNIIFTYLFTTLASGGAVVISQYIGCRAMAVLAGVAMSSAFIMVIGQCMRSGDSNAADYFSASGTTAVTAKNLAEAMGAWKVMIFPTRPSFPLQLPAAAAWERPTRDWKKTVLMQS